MSQTPVASDVPRTDETRRYLQEKKLIVIQIIMSVEENWGGMQRRNKRYECDLEVIIYI